MSVASCVLRQTLASCSLNLCLKEHQRSKYVAEVTAVVVVVVRASSVAAGCRD